jgi:hypothetical protein
MRSAEFGVRNAAAGEVAGLMEEEWGSEESRMEDGSEGTTALTLTLSQGARGIPTK